jgi:diketogulonate reductase-like aldo/keto reductase
MSQKSSLMKIPQFVPKTLTSDNLDVFDFRLEPKEVAIIEALITP